jgi:hypothetical protein
MLGSNSEQLSFLLVASAPVYDPSYVPRPKLQILERTLADGPVYVRCLPRLIES